MRVGEIATAITVAMAQELVAGTISQANECPAPRLFVGTGHVSGALFRGNWRVNYGVI